MLSESDEVLASSIAVPSRVRGPILLVSGAYDPMSVAMALYRLFNIVPSVVSPAIVTTAISADQSVFDGGWTTFVLEHQADRFDQGAHHITSTRMEEELYVINIQ